MKTIIISLIICSNVIISLANSLAPDSIKKVTEKVATWQLSNLPRNNWWI